MFIFLSSTCLQNFSDWHALFVFLLHSVAAAAWSEITFSPADDPFWAFLSPDAQQPVQPQTIFVWLGSWKKYVLGIHPKKDNHPGPLPQQGFCTSLQIWDELGVTWQTKQRFFLTNSGTSNFKHFKQLFMTLSGLGLLTMWELPRGVSYFVSSLL